jgi:hypothetical protein
MVGICWLSAADHAGTLGDKSDMIPVTHPTGFTHAHLGNQPIPQLRRRFRSEHWLGLRA